MGLFNNLMSKIFGHAAPATAKDHKQQQLPQPPAVTRLATDHSSRAKDSIDAAFHPDGNAV